MQRFRTLARTAPDAIVTIDADSTIRYANESVEGVLGRTPEDIQGKPLTVLMPERFRARHRSALKSYLETGERQLDWDGVRLPGLHADGHEVPLEISFAEFEAGSERLFTGVLRDVTGREDRKRKLREQHEQFQRLVAAVEEYAIFMLDPAGHVVTWNEGARRIEGYTESEILGEHISTFYPAEAVEAGLPERLLDLAVEKVSVEDEGWRVRKDGSRFWADVTITAIYDDNGDLDGFTKVVRDMTERKRHEDRLASLKDLSSAFLVADSRQQVADTVIDSAASRLNLPVALVALYDDSTGTLESVAATAAAESTLDADKLLGAGGIAWEAFAEGDARSVSGDADVGLSGGDRIGIWPLGRHGVFVASMDEDVVAPDRAFGGTVAASMQTALDSAERLQVVEEREVRLTDLTDQLERLRRINDAIRRINQVLVGASSRTEIEAAVCEELAEFEPCRFVCLSAFDPIDDTVAVREWAGEEQGYLDAVDVAAGPTGTAAKTREPQAVHETLSDPPLDPWREAALAREFRSCLALPLVYGDSLYGVLTVFGDRPGLFDEKEREVLAELGDNIAHAVNAVESKQALVSDRVIELEFTTSNEDVPFVELATETGGTFAFESVVPQPDGRLKAFFRVREADREDVCRFLRRSMAVEDCQSIGDRDDGILFSCLLTESAVVPHLLDHGAVPRELTAEPGTGKLVVELSREDDVRAFVETLEARFEDVELTGKREHERSQRTPTEFHTAVEDSLTDRQLEVLKTAYFGGYFESPRASTGEDVSDLLGISQPTFADHLRTAHRKVLDLLFDDPTST